MFNKDQKTYGNTGQNFIKISASSMVGMINREEYSHGISERLVIHKSDCKTWDVRSNSERRLSEQRSALPEWVPNQYCGIAKNGGQLL